MAIAATGKSSSGGTAACTAAYQIEESAKGAASAIDLTALQLTQAAAFNALAAKTGDSAAKSVFLAQAADWSRQAKDPSNKNFYDTVSIRRHLQHERLDSPVGKAQYHAGPGKGVPRRDRHRRRRESAAEPRLARGLRPVPGRDPVLVEAGAHSGRRQHRTAERPALADSANQMAATMNSTADSATDPTLKSAMQT